MKIHVFFFFLYALVNVWAFQEDPQDFGIERFRLARGKTSSLTRRAALSQNLKQRKISGFYNKSNSQQLMNSTLPDVLRNGNEINQETFKSFPRKLHNARGNDPITTEIHSQLLQNYLQFFENIFVRSGIISTDWVRYTVKPRATHLASHISHELRENQKAFHDKRKNQMYFDPHFQAQQSFEPDVSSYFSSYDWTPVTEQYRELISQELNIGSENVSPRNFSHSSFNKPSSFSINASKRESIQTSLMNSIHDLIANGDTSLLRNVRLAYSFTHGQIVDLLARYLSLQTCFLAVDSQSHIVHLPYEGSSSDPIFKQKESGVDSMTEKIQNSLISTELSTDHIVNREEMKTTSSLISVDLIRDQKPLKLSTPLFAHSHCLTSSELGERLVQLFNILSKTRVQVRFIKILHFIFLFNCCYIAIVSLILRSHFFFFFFHSPLDFYYSTGLCV